MYALRVKADYREESVTKEAETALKSYVKARQAIEAHRMKLEA